MVSLFLEAKIENVKEEWTILTQGQANLEIIGQVAWSSSSIAGWISKDEFHHTEAALHKHHLGFH